ncbi:B3 domain-containing protein Os05g0481400 [Euphorbia peplus]|nr:B3 domain-containing protein Os05g0481400 [Euphorbia peplus]
MAEHLNNDSEETTLMKTVAELCIHPPPSIPKIILTLPASSSSNRNAPFSKPEYASFQVLEKTGKRVKYKRSYSVSKIKHARYGRASKCIWPDKPAIDRMTSPGKNKSAAVIRAEEIQSNLESEFPSFVKCLVRSHVGSCFWMGLPGPFCRQHLPREETVMTLEDEFGKEFKMKYIGYKTGLSAGWRQFAVAHKLLEGDALVFQYIDHCKFKFKNCENEHAKGYVISIPGKLSVVHNNYGCKCDTLRCHFGAYKYHFERASNLKRSRRTIQGNDDQSGLRFE